MIIMVPSEELRAANSPINCHDDTVETVLFGRHLHRTILL